MLQYQVWPLYSLSCLGASECYSSVAMLELDPIRRIRPDSSLGVGQVMASLEQHLHPRPMLQPCLLALNEEK
jgi:hypothetical protein